MWQVVSLLGLANWDKRGNNVYILPSPHIRISCKVESFFYIPAWRAAHMGLIFFSAFTGK